MATEDLNKLNLGSDISLFGSADPNIGKALGGRWEIQQFVGEGSMSAAYRALDLQSGDVVVVKILHAHLLANNKNLKRFEQRAKSTSSLRHRHIGTVLDIQLTPEGSVFLVVEQLQGESLEDLLAKSGHLSPEHAVDAFIDACGALEYAHGEDVLHRDLKPSNIMLVEAGGLRPEVKLVDFGVARLLSEDADDVKTSGYITRTREVFGSPMYMSPEQCMGKRLDGRSDIYSLGCVMYETLTGKPPFVGKNVLETAYKHMNEMPKAFAADRPNDRTLGRFEAIIFKCLAKDPNDRYQSVAQLRADLEIMQTATEPEWAATAYALKRITRLKKKEQKRKMPVVSFELGVFAGLSILLVAVVAIWSFSFLGNESQEYAAFNNDTLWISREKTTPHEVQDFGSKEEALRMDIATTEREKGSNSREYANQMMQLMNLYISAKHWSEAGLTVKKLIETINRVGGPMDLPTAYAFLGVCYYKQGQFQDAEVAAQNSLDEAEKSGLSGQNVVLAPLKVLGDIYNQKKELDKAADTYERLYNVVEARKLTAPAEFANAAAQLGDIYRRQNKLENAERYYRLALETSRNSYSQDNPNLPKCLYGLGLVLAKENNTKEAEDSFREALPLARKAMGERSALAGAVKKQLQDVLWRNNWISAIMMRMTESK